jgi:putative transposase
VKAHQAEHSVAAQCRVLEVSPSGYYAQRKRAPSQRSVSDAALGDTIAEIYQASGATYGVPRIHAELADEPHSLRVSRKRVARLMRERGLVGAHRRRRPPRTTIQNKDARPAPDLVKRNFTATGPNQLWVADITYVPTWSGFLFLAVVLDVFSRRIVGWAMATHMRTELILDALSMAMQQRRPGPGVIHHSDQGTQYTSIAFGLRCRAWGVRPSMGSVGDCYDNAMCESFFATLECEMIDRTPLPNPQEARLAVFRFIEGWYNPRRRHSSIGYLAPAEYERRYDAQKVAA